MSLHDCAIGLFSCSEEAVRQLVSGGVIESLVALTSHRDSVDVANAATSLLLSIASKAPNLRQYLGRGGAVEYFVHCMEERVTFDGTLSHKYHAIDALCQCCRDANNRIKVRELGGLSVLTNLLSDSKLAKIHGRIISALVCFIYDDASIVVLLHSHLVPTLVSHLYRAAGIAKRPDFIGLDSFDIRESFRVDPGNTTTDDISEYSDDDLIVTTADQSSSFPLHTEVKQNSDLLSHDSFVDYSISNDRTGTAVLDTSSAVGTSVIETDRLNDDDCSDGKLEFVGDESVVSEPVEFMSKASSYSINSPTYKAVSAWRMEEAEDTTGDRHSPRNIWEGAQLYAEHFSASSACGGSVSPCRSVGSVSDGLHSVQSWSSSSSSPQKSPGVSPAWSLDSSGSGMYSPFSNSSYLYPDGACSPLSFSDVDETQPVSLSGCQCLGGKSEAATASHVSGSSQPCQPHCHSVTTAHLESSANVRLTEEGIITELPAFVTDESDARQQNDNAGSSGELLSSVNVICRPKDEVDGDRSAARSKLEGGNEEEEESTEQCWDDGFEAESFQRKRRDERKFSRLLDIAQIMYASVETEPGLSSRRTKKRRRSSSGGNASPSKSTRRTGEFQRTDVSATISASDTNDLEALPSEDLHKSGVSCGNNVRAQIPQPVQIAGDANSAEMNSDTESATSDDVLSACSARHRHVGRVTERNILIVLSRISHSTETVAHVMNAGTICALLDYALLAGSPLPAAGRTLLRLSRSQIGFQRAVLCLFPVHAAWRMEPDWLSDMHQSKESACFCQGHRNDTHIDVDPVDLRVSGEDSQSFKQERSSELKMTEIVSKRKGNQSSCSLSSLVSNSSAESDEAERCVASELCDEVIANLSVVAISGYGQGVVSHVLLRGSRHQRERCVVSLGILCRFVLFFFLI